MKNNNSTFIVLGGIFILSVFSFIVAKNILPDSDNNQYYAKPNENMIDKIESITKENNKIMYYIIAQKYFARRKLGRTSWKNYLPPIVVKILKKRG